MNREDEIMNKKKEAMKQLRGDRKEWITMASTMVKEQRKERKAIKKYLENQPATVPEIADATGIPSDKVLWYLATLKKYGDIVEGEKDGSFFRYVLTESAPE
ncbi:MAG: winged helix-turn-helix domain-containing protein [Desulfobacterales bacterium]|jgi:predicted transcriptional regulator|nr:winged helix-turn-helix domain-containing protein [Desulfobacterales bacterium]